MKYGPRGPDSCPKKRTAARAVKATRSRMVLQSAVDKHGPGATIEIALERLRHASRRKRAPAPRAYFGSEPSTPSTYQFRRCNSGSVSVLPAGILTAPV